MLTMGSWGVRSYENDDADFAIDAGLERVHGAAYEDLMEDDNPLTIDQIHRQLANAATLDAAVENYRAEVDQPWDNWDDEQRLALVGIVVRHAEMNVPIPDEIRFRALEWLHSESSEWDEATARRLRREREIELLER